MLVSLEMIDFTSFASLVFYIVFKKNVYVVLMFKFVFRLNPVSLSHVKMEAVAITTEGMDFCVFVAMGLLELTVNW